MKIIGILFGVLGGWQFGNYITAGFNPLVLVISLQLCMFGFMLIVLVMHMEGLLTKK